MSCLRLRFGRLARIGELIQVALVLVEIRDRRFVADREEHHVAAFLRLADRPELGALRRGLGDRLQVAVNVGRVIEDARRADDVAEELERRRHGGGRGKVIDQLGRDARIGEVLLDLRGVLRVHLLRGLRLRGRGDGLRQCAGGEQRHTPTAHRTCRTRHPVSCLLRKGWWGREDPDCAEYLSSTHETAKSRGLYTNPFAFRREACP